MSIKKEVVLRAEVMTIYSSEMQERMKVYFQLNDKYNECYGGCVEGGQGQDGFCRQLCAGVYEDYVRLLYDRYKDNPEKLEEQVSGSPIFETRRREHTKTWRYWLFGN